MGLSGRREKQRIPNDPRNLSWADNAAKFGQAYLSKLGWDSSKGLGIEGDGRTSHIKVSQKLDMLGIGAAHSKDVNGIAWKQNKEFEELLKRLNEGAGADSGADQVGEEETPEEKDKDDKKRKRKQDEDGAGEQEKKRRKKEKNAKDPTSKKKQKSKTADGGTAQVVEETNSVTVTAPVKAAARRPAHRARFIASKNLASKSASAISEILGIAPTSSSATPLPSTPTSTPTEGMLTQLDENHTLEKLTTSTKSVADYFKERLVAKMGGTHSLSSNRSESMYDREDDAFKGGLGSSRLKVEPTEEGATRMGLGIGMSRFGSLMSGAFLASLPAAAEITEKAVTGDTSTLEVEGVRATTETTADNPIAGRDEPTEESETRRKEKKARKEKRRQKDNERDVAVEQLKLPGSGDVRCAEKARKKAERKAAKKVKLEA